MPLGWDLLFKPSTSNDSNDLSVSGSSLGDKIRTAVTCKLIKSFFFFILRSFDYARYTFLLAGIALKARSQPQKVRFRLLALITVFFPFLQIFFYIVRGFTGSSSSFP